MPRPRLRPGIAVCTCAWRSPPSVRLPARDSSTAATTTVQTPSDAPLDFLYPSFGFFSRSLPAASLSPAGSVDDASVDLVTGSPRGLSGAKWSNATWRRGLALRATSQCACGRARNACIRCRNVSTSAVLKPVTHQEEGEEEPELHEVDTPAHQLGSPPAHPPPLPKARQDRSESSSSSHGHGNDPLLPPSVESK